MEIPEFDIHTQGRDHYDCIKMSIDAIKTLFGEDSVDIKFLSFDGTDKFTFYLTLNKE